MAMLVSWSTSLVQTEMPSPKRTNPEDFGDLVTVPLATPWGWYLWFFSEISQQLLDAFLWNLVHTFTSPWGLILITLMIPWYYIVCHHQGSSSTKPMTFPSASTGLWLGLLEIVSMLVLMYSSKPIYSLTEPLYCVHLSFQLGTL